MRQAPLPPHFLIDHFKQVESISAPKYTGAGIPPAGGKKLQLLCELSVALTAMATLAFNHISATNVKLKRKMPHAK